MPPLFVLACPFKKGYMASDTKSILRYFCQLLRDVDFGKVDKVDLFDFFKFPERAGNVVYRGRGANERT